MTLIQMCSKASFNCIPECNLLRRNTAGFQEVYAENKLKAKIKSKLKLDLTLSQTGCAVKNSPCPKSGSGLWIPGP